MIMQQYQKQMDEKFEKTSMQLHILKVKVNKKVDEEKEIDVKQLKKISQNFNLFKNLNLRLNEIEE